VPEGRHHRPLPGLALRTGYGIRVSGIMNLYARFRADRSSIGTGPFRRGVAHTSRRGAAVVELAVLLPLLVLLFIGTVDFGRIFYFSLTLQNAARAGALYASDPETQHESPFASVQEAALADATNLDPQPTITQTSGTDGTGRNYVEVTASYTFDTITGFPGIPSTVDIRRTVRMYEAAMTPDSW